MQVPATTGTVGIRRVRAVDLATGQWRGTLDFQTKSIGCFLLRNLSAWRPCDDYRALNAVKKRSRYRIPFLQDFSASLCGKTIFSKLGLAKADHQFVQRIYKQPRLHTIRAFRIHTDAFRVEKRVVDVPAINLWHSEVIWFWARLPGWHPHF